MNLPKDESEIDPIQFVKVSSWRGKLFLLAIAYLMFLVFASVVESLNPIEKLDPPMQVVVLMGRPYSYSSKSLVAWPEKGRPGFSPLNKGMLHEHKIKITDSEIHRWAAAWNLNAPSWVESFENDEIGFGHAYFLLEDVAWFE